MTDKGFSSTKFWLTQLGLIGLLITIAIVIIFLRQQSKNAPKPQGQLEEVSIATGLSNFYRQYKLSSSKPISDASSDFVLDVANDDTSLERRLKSMSSDFKPVNRRWVGDHKYRTFETGSTLRTALSGFAQQEGMQVVWDLNKDFVIKHQFQTNDTIIGSVADVAASIDANFSEKVNAYFCSKQRAVVITTHRSRFIQRECRLAK